MIGTRLGRYRIVGRLGAGGMGEVYEAEDTSLSRAVALKLLPPAMIGDSSRRARLEREARAIAALEHPNIVTLHAVEESDGQLYLVMERVRGSTLADRLPAGGFPLDEVLELAVPLASAIGAAHARGLVHRDLKPANVMVTDGGQLKVLDFGIAQWSEAASSEPGLAVTETADGGVVGTVAYMSPEQARGLRVDARSDVYSLGVVLFELATGRRPFESGAAISLALAIINDPPPPPSSLVPGLPTAFDQLVLRCLDKDPDRRPTSGAELERELRGLRGEIATGHRAPGVTRRDAPGVARRGHRRRIALLGGLGLAAAAVAAVIVLGRSPTAPRQPADPLPAAPPGAPGAAAVTVTDLPPPSSPSHDALVAYAAGMQTWRDGSIDRAADFFEKAVALDPGMGAAYLRIALRSPRPPGERAVFFKDAVDRRASLPPHEALLLDVFAPCWQGRSEADRWCVQAAADASRSFPENAELAFWSAKTLLDAGRFREAVAGFDHALELDPKFGLAWVVRIHTLSYLGDFAEAERSIPRCTAVSPADRCIVARAKLVAPAGRCDELETVALSILGLDPGNRVGLLYLTGALASQDRSRAVVQTAADRVADSFPEPTGWRLRIAQGLAESRGEIDVALAALAERERAAATSRELSTHGELIEARIRLSTELGRIADAGAAARDYLERSGALLSAGTEDDGRMRIETPGFALLAELRAGLITKAELRAERDRFVASWRPRLGPGYLPYLWLDAYATTVDDADDAREALSALPDFGGLPRFYYYDPLQDLVGRTFLLAGRLDEAIEWLGRAAAACDLPLGNRSIGASLLLGQALDQKGDRVGACAAYGAVLRRWGPATAKSATAEAARRRARDLRCR